MRRDAQGGPAATAADGRPTSTALASLPGDVLMHIATSCAEADLLAMSASCRSLHAMVEAPSLWQAKICGRHARALGVFFAGAVPPPPAGLSWKQHAFAFDREWLAMARRASGRTLLRMSSNCALSDPAYLGVPPARGPVASNLRLPGSARVHPIHLDLFGWCCEPTFGIFDATEFVAHHPGAEQMLHAASLEDDCTDSFDAANHTERARTILRQLAVPGMQALPQLAPLTRPRPRPSTLTLALAAMLRLLRMLPALPALVWNARASPTRRDGETEARTERAGNKAGGSER